VTPFTTLFAVFVASLAAGPTGSGSAGGAGSGPDCCVTFGTLTTSFPPTVTAAGELGPPTETLVSPTLTVRAWATPVPHAGTMKSADASTAPRTRARPWRTLTIIGT
jgi:hypothetical protein